ncbi:MAG TPA: S-layer homology domain-containing protein [Chloroflexia bacterium]|nr:S-layer homology domain-containing protein [Chloroflexia bacterium]
METRIVTYRGLTLLLSAIGLLLCAGLAASSALADKQPDARDQAYGTVTANVACSTTTVIASPNSASNPNSLTEVEVISPDDVWAVGSSGGYHSAVLTMHWDGTAWSIVPSPAFGLTWSVFRGISAVSTNDVWAAGNASDGILILHWDGVQWSRVPTPGLFATIYDIDAVSSTDVWAVGGGRITFTMHWDGSAWSRIDSPNVLASYDGFEQNTLYEVDAVSANDVWAVGYGGAPDHPDIRSEGNLGIHWDGTRWATVISGPLVWNQNSRLYAISALATDDIWTVGFQSGTGPFTLHWDGSNWISVPLPSQVGSIYDVQMITTSSVYAIGIANGQRCILHWDGTGWSVVSTPDTNIATIMGLSESTLWAVVSMTDTTYTLKWNGTGWDRVESPNWMSGYNTLRTIEVFSPTDIWAVGYYAPYTNDYSAYRARTLIQHWDGTQWSIVPSPNGPGDTGYLYDISGSSPDDIWAVGDYVANISMSYKQPLTLHWNGNTWSVVPTVDHPYSMSLSAVEALSSDNVWAVGSGNTGDPQNRLAHIIHWDGAQWVRDTSITGNPNESSHLAGIAVVSNNDMWAVGEYRSTPSSPFQTYIVRWNGTKWSWVTSPNVGTNNNRLLAVTALSANDVWAVGYAGPPGVGQALALHWDGAQWNVVPTPAIGDSSYFIGIDAASSGEVWAVGNYLSGGIPHTLVERWSGAQWEEVTTTDLSSRSNYFSGVAVVSPGEVLAVGEYGFEDAQLTLVEKVATNVFSDVPVDNVFYPYVRCLINHGIISGYSDCTFRPNNDVTRGQLAKIVSNSAGFEDDPGPQLFEDVPPGSTFYDWINRLANRGYISGYPCGGPGEPCGSNNLPYFRPYTNTTRGQISKIVSNAAGYNDTPPGQTFEDVPPTNTFYLWIERLASRGIMGGYPCGSEGEPCGPDNKPYFRWGNNATRGQTSKIVANTFFPGCQVAATR